MKRFIFVTFAFLAWSFYELSGGADYAPRVKSDPVFAPVVTRAATEPNVTIPRSVSTQSAGSVEPSAQVIQAALTTNNAPAPKPQTAVTGSFVTVKPAPDRVSVTLTPKAPRAETVTKDLRAVSGKRVNMRTGPGKSFSVVSTLSQGMPVEVIDDEGDGWLKLRVVDTGDIGYMADWLVTAAN